MVGSGVRRALLLGSMEMERLARGASMGMRWGSGEISFEWSLPRPCSSAAFSRCSATSSTATSSWSPHQTCQHRGMSNNSLLPQHSADNWRTHHMQSANDLQAQLPPAALNRSRVQLPTLCTSDAASILATKATERRGKNFS